MYNKKKNDYLPKIRGVSMTEFIISHASVDDSYQQQLHAAGNPRLLGTLESGRGRSHGDRQPDPFAGHSEPENQ